jgi:hypothetical protein
MLTVTTQQRYSSPDISENDAQILFFLSIFLRGSHHCAFHFREKQIVPVAWLYSRPSGILMSSNLGIHSEACKMRTPFGTVHKCPYFKGASISGCKITERKAVWDLSRGVLISQDVHSVNIPFGVEIVKRYMNRHSFFHFTRWLFTGFTVIVKQTPRKKKTKKTVSINFFRLQPLTSTSTLNRRRREGRMRSESAAAIAVMHHVSGAGLSTADDEQLLIDDEQIPEVVFNQRTAV